MAADEVGQWSVSINVESVLFHRASFNILTENEGFVSDIRFVNIGCGATQKGKNEISVNVYNSLSGYRGTSFPPSTLQR